MRITTSVYIFLNPKNIPRSYILDTTVRFFPNEPNPKSPDVPAAHTAYITVYYGDGRNIDTVLDDIINAVSPNIKILVGMFEHRTL